MRCFIAMGIGDDIKKPIAAMVDDLRSAVSEGRPRVTWTRPDGWHVTLKFLGDVDDDTLGEVTDNLRRVAAETGASFTIRAHGLATFPSSGRKPRAIVVPIEDDGSAARLAATVDAAMTPLGFEPDGRPYVAHLTVGRVRDHKGWGRMAVKIRDYEAREFGKKTIESVALYESQLQPGGARYTVLQEFPLSTGV